MRGAWGFTWRAAAWMPLRVLRILLIPVIAILATAALGAVLSNDLLSAGLLACVTGICAELRARLLLI